MSAHEIEAAIIRLTPQQLFGILAWLEMVHTQSGQPEGELESDHDRLDTGHVEPEDMDAAAD